MAAARSGLLAAGLLLGLCLGPLRPARAVESGSEWNEGLEEFFHKVDRDGDGQIEAQEAAQYIGDSDIQDGDLGQAVEQVCARRAPAALGLFMHSEQAAGLIVRWPADAGEPGQRRPGRHDFRGGDEDPPAEPAQGAALRGPEPAPHRRCGAPGTPRPCITPWAPRPECACRATAWRSG